MQTTNWILMITNDPIQVLMVKSNGPLDETNLNPWKWPNHDQIFDWLMSPPLDVGQ